ncbi:MAG: excisionase [Lachnospiraceae bacterium]|nr:excisionase [Lachnospiraceae bacterium]
MDNLNKDEIPVWKKVTITKEEAASYSHIGLNKLEELLKIPNCSFVFYVGKKKLIKRKEFEDFIATNVEI